MMTEGDSVYILYHLFNSNTVIFILFLLAVLYIFVKKECLVKQNYIIPSLILLLVLFNPPMMNLVTKYMVEERAVRLYWLLPIIIVIAFVCTDIVFQISAKNKRAALVAIQVIFMIIMGTCILSSHNFKKSENIYKIPDEAIKICEAIEEDGNRGTLWPTLRMSKFIRQYDGNIVLEFGINLSENYRSYEDIERNELNVWTLRTRMVRSGCRYLLVEKEKTLVGNFEICGFKKLLETDEHYLYRFDDMENGNFIITQYASAQNVSANLMTIMDMKGHLIIIDGGSGLDFYTIYDDIYQFDQNVAAWILTACSQKDTNTFYTVYKGNHAEIQSVYAFDKSPDMDYEDNPELTELFYELGNMELLKKGQTVDLYGLQMTVIDSGNQGMSFRIDSENKSALYLSPACILNTKILTDNKLLDVDYLFISVDALNLINEEWLKSISPDCIYIGGASDAIDKPETITKFSYKVCDEVPNYVMIN